MSQQNIDSRLAKRVSRIGLSMTVKIAQRARELQAQGKKIINMGAGELDFDTPEYIKLGAIKGILEGQTRYTNVGGTTVLTQAIQQKFQRENQLSYELSEIVAGTGAKQLLFNALQATVDESDEVIIPAPYWVSYPDMVRLADGTPVTVTTTVDSGYKITPDQLRAALTAQTKWLLINSPGNPTGAIYSREELQALADVLKDYPRVLVLSDDIYEPLTYDVPFISFATAAPELKDRTLTLNGVSKGYAMTGWRLGYAAGPEWLIKAMEKIQAQSTSNPSSVSQAAAATALMGDSSFLTGWRDILVKRRNEACEILAASSLLHLEKPQGAFYLFVDCQPALGKTLADGSVLADDLDIARFLIEHASVAVVPGSAFGMSGHFRLAFSIASEDVTAACKAIVAAMETLK